MWYYIVVACLHSMTIVEAIRKDPENGAKRLESEYKAGLTAFAMRFYPDASDAEALVYRTFAEVVRSIDSFNEHAAFFTWMCRILVNCHAVAALAESCDFKFRPLHP